MVIGAEGVWARAAVAAVARATLNKVLRSDIGILLISGNAQYMHLYRVYPLLLTEWSNRLYGRCAASADGNSGLEGTQRQGCIHALQFLRREQLLAQGLR